MIYDKTLRWREPFGGWEKSDTGLCNRILHWEIAYVINKRNYFDYRILLNKTDWPELALITLPETSAFISYEYDIKAQDLNFVTVLDVDNFDVRKASKIDTDRLYYMFGNDELYLSQDKHWYSDFGFTDINHLSKKPIDKRPLSLIKLRDQFIEDLLKRNSYDTVGIHIRRNSGVKYDNECAKTLPESVRDEFWGFKDKSPKINHEYPFIPDEKYFEIIDNILKVNPDQKFYISTDLPYEFFSYYKERYGDLIMTRYDFYDIVREHLVNSEMNVNNLTRGNVIENIIDLFSLSFCKFLISSDKSTWSEFAQHYRSQPTVSANDDWETVIKPKYVNPDWGQPEKFEDLFEDKNLDINDLKKIAPKNVSQSK
jgi:hypothetical protein